MLYIKHYIYYCIELQVIEAPHGSYIEVQARMILLLYQINIYIYIYVTQIRCPPPGHKLVYKPHGL